MLTHISDIRPLKVKYTSEKGWCPTKQSQLAWRENTSTFQPLNTSCFPKKLFICSAKETLLESLKCVDYLWYIAMLWSTVTIRKSTFCIITLCFWTRWNIILFAINVTYYWRWFKKKSGINIDGLASIYFIWCVLVHEPNKTSACNILTVHLLHVL